MSPSEAKHQIVWSNEALAGLGVRVVQAALVACAIAMPTALATPWPSGPVVISTPSGVAVLGVARGQRAPLPQQLEVLDRQAVAGQEQLDVEREAGVAAAQHEPVAAEPGRVGRVVAQQPLEQQVRRGRQAHRRAGMAVAGGLDGVHGEAADDVHRELVRSRSSRASGSSMCSRCSSVGCSWSSVVRSPVAASRAPERSRDSLVGPPGNRPDRVQSGSPASASRVTPRAGRCATAQPVTLMSPRCGAGQARRAVQLRRADQAPNHRAAARHDPAGDGPRRQGACRRCGPRAPRWSAARWPPAAPTRSTASSTATSTRSCTGPSAARWPASRSPPVARAAVRHRARRGRDAAARARRQLAVGGAGRRRDRCSTSSSTPSGLKRRTPSNIVIGGAAGCFPVLIGWSAVRGDVGWPAVVLFAVDVPLDAAALLGAGDAVQGRLRRGRRADAAGRGARGVGDPPDRRATRGRWSPRRSCWCRSVPAIVYTSPPPVLGAVFLVEAHRLHRRVHARRAGASRWRCSTRRSAT